MNDSDRPYIGPHDVGGRPADAIDPADREFAHWERVVDALVILLIKKNVFSNAAQLRGGCEDLKPSAYAKLTHYELLAQSATSRCIACGLVEQNELDARAENMKTRGYR